MARLGRPGAALEHRPKVFGAPTQTFWSSWGRLGASWGAPGGVWGRLGAVLGPLGLLLGPPGPLLGVILASRGGLFGSLFERAWKKKKTLIFLVFSMVFEGLWWCRGVKNGFKIAAKSLPGASWRFSAPLGALLGLSWGSRGASWCFLGRSWRLLVALGAF